ncbi:MAG TPA: hypothetical protein VHO02_03990, partial [Fibrobacteria bacterium]|nr:hypothetical protein [Fibrobacteria bacterium]
SAPVYLSSMLKLGCGLIALLALLAAAMLLWITPGFAAALPSGLAGWTGAWFAAFRNPGLSIWLFAFCTLLAVAAACVTELLLGILFSVLAALVSLFCLMGVLGARFPGVAEWVEKLLR